MQDTGQQEKADILNMFQQNADPNSTFTLSQLEGHVEEKQFEKVELQKEQKEAKEMCIAARNELKESNETTKDLVKQLAGVKRQIEEQEGRESQQEQIRMNEMRIDELENQLKKAKQKIRSLQDDNAMLKQALFEDD